MTYEQFGPVDGRGGGQDAVVVVWVALGEHESLASAGRAALEIRVSGRLAVEGLDDGFTDD